jgi:hypothetical protein
VKRQRLIKSIFFAVLVCASSQAQTISLTYRGMMNTGQSCRTADGGTLAVNGLSGITHLRDDSFLAVMDNSNRVIRMKIALGADGSIGSAGYDGAIQVAQHHDYEGIAIGANLNSVFLSEEDTPAIREFRMSDGAFVRQVALPPVYLRGNTRGNFGLESLTIRDGQMWTANEEALRSDGDRSTAKSGCIVRLTHFFSKGNEWSADKQFAYVTDPIPGVPNDADRGTSRSGVSDLMLLPDGRLLVLERAFALSGPANLLSKFRNAIYLADGSDATDILPLGNSLKGSRILGVKKTLLWSHEGNDIGNLEGLALGPRLGDNRWAVVGVVDNNANALMPNRVVSFELSLDAIPSTRSSR